MRNTGYMRDNLKPMAAFRAAVRMVAILTSAIILATFTGVALAIAASVATSGAHAGKALAVTDTNDVIIYIMDTGISTSYANSHHMAGRIEPGFDAYDPAGNGILDDTCTDHGTHVADLAAGADYGTAAHAIIIPIRVLRCSEESEEAIGGPVEFSLGVEWILAHHKAHPAPAVVNVSLGVPGAISVSHDWSTQRLLSAGLIVVASAGNESLDACGQSPGRVPGVITVGALTRGGLPADFTNTGSCVDLYAPGVRLTSAEPTRPDTETGFSGTSAAAPVVSGLAARYLATHPDATAEDVQHVLTAILAEDAVPLPGVTSQLARFPV
jgi:subtilisin family serine protease